LRKRRGEEKKKRVTTFSGREKKRREVDAWDFRATKKRERKKKISFYIFIISIFFRFHILHK
jgi:hypothetical protein